MSEWGTAIVKPVPPKTKKQETYQEGHRSGVKTVCPKQSGNKERCAVLKLQERQADEPIAKQSIEVSPSRSVKRGILHRVLTPGRIDLWQQLYKC